MFSDRGLARRRDYIVADEEVDEDLVALGTDLNAVEHLEFGALCFRRRFHCSDDPLGEIGDIIGGDSRLSLHDDASVGTILLHRDSDSHILDGFANLFRLTAHGVVALVRSGP